MNYNQYYYPDQPYYHQAQHLQHQPPPLAAAAHLQPAPPPPPLQHNNTHQQPLLLHQHQQQQQQSPPPPQQLQPALSASTSLLRRGPWSPLEDKKLLDLIGIFGPTNWVRISNSLATRTPKQCRERYHQNLKPLLNRLPITLEEGELIESLVAKYGKKWAEISRHLNGRSDNAIKNWWNGGANRRRRASLANPAVPGQEDAVVSDHKPSPDAPAAASHDQKDDNTPSQFPQVPHLPQISFNTSMFGNSPAHASLTADVEKPLPAIKSHDSATPPLPPTASTGSPYRSGSVSSQTLHLSRSASFDAHNFTTLPPILSSNKRRLLEDPISRRHSTANSSAGPPASLHGPGSGAAPFVQPHYANSSHPNLTALHQQHSAHHANTNSATATGVQSGNLSPSYYGSPLLLSTQASRNNSISHFEFSTLNSSVTNNSSRRSSSIAPDLFPNPLKDVSSAHQTHKRNLSQNSAFNSPLLTPSTRFSVSSTTSILNNSTHQNSQSTNTSPMSNYQVKNLNASSFTTEKDEKEGVKTKISVSSLID